VGSTDNITVVGSVNHEKSWPEVFVKLQCARASAKQQAYERDSALKRARKVTQLCSASQNEFKPTFSSTRAVKFWKFWDFQQISACSGSGIGPTLKVYLQKMFSILDLVG
jgi:hypothetical protein